MRPCAFLLWALLAWPAGAQPRGSPAPVRGLSLPALPALPEAGTPLAPAALPGLRAESDRPGPSLAELQGPPDLRAVAAAGIEIQGRAPRDYEDSLLWEAGAEQLAESKAAEVRRLLREAAGPGGGRQGELGHLFDAAGRDWALRFEREPGEVDGALGGYAFHGEAVLSRSLLVLPERDLVPVAAHELHHLHEHERGLAFRTGFAMEVRAHRTQNAAERAARTLGWRDGFVGLPLRSPSLRIEIPILFPARLAPYARAYWRRGLDLAHPLLVQALRHYRSLSTIHAAEEAGRLNDLLEPLYPER